MCCLSLERKVALRMKVALGSSKGCRQKRISVRFWEIQIITHCILLLPQDLTGRLKIDSKKRHVTLVRQADVLDGGDVEWSDEAVDRKNDGVLRLVDVNLITLISAEDVFGLWNH